MQLLASILVFSLLVLDSDAIQVKYSQDQKIVDLEDDIKQWLSVFDVELHIK